MRYEDFIPIVETEFHTWQRVLMKQLAKHYKDWGITETEWAALTALQVEFQTKFAAANYGETRTSAAIILKNTALAAYKKQLRVVIKAHITYNLAITEGERVKMHLPVHKTTRTPVPPPVEGVNLVLRQLPGHRVRVSFTPASQIPVMKKHGEGKPFGVRGAELRWAILPAPPKSQADLVYSEFSTRTPYIFEFDIPQAGKTLYVCARWENTTGKKGPWSKIVDAIIP